MTRIASLATCCLLAGAALFAGLANWPDTPDGWLHLQRVRALAEALQAGVLYPRWFPDFSFGYGYPVLNYYAPGFYYGPALLVLGGLDVTTAVRLTLGLLFAVSALGMYLFLRLWTDVLPALLGTVLFLVFPYRLYDLFVRGALPEFAAFLWLPWIAYFTARRGPGNLAAAALCCAGLILTHNLTALLFGLTVLALLPVATLVCAKASPSYGVGRAFLTAGWTLFAPLALGALLSAWYWAPALLEAAWVGIGSGTETAGYANHFATWRDLFTWAPLFPYPPAAAPVVPLPGFVGLAILGAAVALAVARRTPRGALLGGGLVAVILAAWLTTAPSEFAWRLFEPLLGKLQFPWRWQTIVGPGVAVLVGVAAAVGWATAQQAGGLGRQRRGATVGAAALAVAAMAWLVAYATLGLPIAPGGTKVAAVTTDAMWATDSRNGQVGASWTGEFLPNTVTEQRWAIGQAPSDGSSAAALPPVALRARPLHVGYSAAAYAVSVAQPAALILHQFFFPSWRVAIDGVPAAARPAPGGGLGLLAVDLPAGEHTVTVAWGPTPAVWAGRVLAAGGWLWMLGLLVTWGRRRQWGWQGRGAVAASLAAGMLFLVGATGVTARWAAPLEVGADFGPLRLEAAGVEGAHAGEAAQIRLYWTVQGPAEPLVAFVHVVNAAGAVVAQHDGPLGGDYTPYTRWQGGLVLAHTHRVPLPDDLPPGRYTVKAGVYPPGQPDAPLLPAGAADPRVDVGVLEVQP
jgi:hypothetical protein